MPDIREVSREEAERIWAGKCPVCNGKLLGTLDTSGDVVCVKAICEFGCTQFNVPPRPEMPQRIQS